jgi:hypothetical protein
MTKIILIDKDIARVGYKFIYRESSDCQLCKHKEVCLGKLASGRVYMIKSVKKPRKKIVCRITDGEMVLAEVELATITTAINNRRAIEDIVTVWSKMVCSEVICKNRSICFPSGLQDGDRVKILRVKDKVECPLNYSLRIVSVLPFR